MEISLINEVGIRGINRHLIRFNSYEEKEMETVDGSV